MKKSSLSKTSALIVSTLSNPFLVLALTLVGSNFSLIQAQPHQAIIFFITSVTLPVGFYIYTVIDNKKELFDFPTIDRKKRYVIFLSAVFSSLITTILFMFTGQDLIWAYTAMVLGVFFAIFYMINRYIDKLSLHAGVFAFSMIYLADKVNILFAIFLAILPIIYWARIRLHQHTWFQLMLGSAVGMFIGLLTWTF